jgi:uncharacterized protein YbjQ (UPF0145 family)
MEYVINLAIFLALVVIGYFAGSAVEKKHYRSIREREKALMNLPAVTFKTPPYADEEIAESGLVSGSAVISTDYFKSFLAALRKIFGGRLRTYESLLDRARREALLRMKAAAGDADMIVNVRLETAPIGGKENAKGGVMSVEVLAYGTALKLKHR